MAYFTREEIEHILQEYFDTESKQQYVGARYITIFGRKGEDTMEWDDGAPYEPLTVVVNEGNSYVSRTYVPTGIDISDTRYWLKAFNFNAQVEQYRRDVAAFDDRITTNTNNITAANGRIDDEVLARTNADAALTNRLDATDGNLAALQTSYNNCNKGILVLGDSYGEGYTPDGNVTSWVTMFTNHVSRYGFNVYSKSYGGTGFWREDVNKRFSTLATQVIETLTDTQKKSIGTVIVGGGYNDRENSNADILNGMIALRDVINQNLVNVKRVLIFPFGMGVEGLTTGSHASFTYSMIQNMIRNYINANANALLGTVVGGANMLLRRNNYFSSDFVHPSVDGQFIIANFVSDVFLGNPESMMSPRYNTYYTPNITYNEGVSGEQFQLMSESDSFIVTTPSGGFIRFTTPITIGLNQTPINIGTFADAALQKNANFRMPIIAVFRSTTSTPKRYVSVQAALGFTNGNVYVQGMTADDAGTNFMQIDSVDQIQYLINTYPRFDGLYLQ